MFLHPGLNAGCRNRELIGEAIVWIDGFTRTADSKIIGIPLVKSSKMVINMSLWLIRTISWIPADYLNGQWL